MMQRLRAALNDAGLPGGGYPPGRPEAEFISENPQDSEISRDNLVVVLQS
jgi:hypothetical protein